MRNIDLNKLGPTELAALVQHLMQMMATYADLNQRLYNAFKAHSKDDLPAILEAWSDGVVKAEEAFDGVWESFATDEPGAMN